MSENSQKNNGLDSKTITFLIFVGLIIYIFKLVIAFISYLFELFKILIVFLFKAVLVVAGIALITAFFILLLYFLRESLYWFKERKRFYNNDYNKFYSAELRLPIQVSLSVLLVISGCILLFFQYQLGLLFILSSLPFIPFINNFLKMNLGLNTSLLFKCAALFFLAIPTLRLINNEIEQKETELRIESHKKNQEEIKLKNEANIREQKRLKNEIILKKRKDSLNFYLEQAEIELVKNNLRKAKEGIEKAKVMRLYDERIYLSDGLYYEKSKNYQKAINTFIHVSQNGTNYANAAYHIGYCYFKIKKEDSAISYLKKANDLGNDEAQKLYYSLETKRTKRQNLRTQKKTTKAKYSSKGYIRGPRGGCYYINRNGNKTYVDRSLCN